MQTCWLENPKQLIKETVEFSNHKTAPTNGTNCNPLGITWLTIGFMGKCVYQRFLIVKNLSSPFVLGIDFMTRTSLTLHVPTRTVLLDDNPPCFDELYEKGFVKADLKCGTMNLQNAPQLSLHHNV